MTWRIGGEVIVIPSPPHFTNKIHKRKGMFHVKQLRSYYTSPYKVSNDVIEEVTEYQVTCDAYTVITEDDYLVNVLAAKWAKYSEFAQRTGNKVKPYRNNQYRGWQVGSMRYAINPYGKGTLLSVTGSLSDVTIEEVLGFSLRATRFDIAATFFLSSPLPDYAAQLYDARVMQGDKGRIPIGQWKLLSSPTGDTLYVGTRGTGKFIRVYDKSLQYTGVAERGYVWRFEMEYGTGYADTLFQQLRTEIDNERSISDYMVKRLWGDCYQKGVALPVRVEALADNELRKDKKPTDKDRYLTWIGKTVRPVVQWLVAMGYGEDVSEALGVQQNFLDIIDQNELVQAAISLTGPEGKSSL